MYNSSQLTRTLLNFSKLILFLFLFTLLAAPGWAEPATHTINSLDDLKALCEEADNASQRNYTFYEEKVAAGDVIDFQADIALDYWLRIDQNVTIHGNGHKLTAKDGTKDGTALVYLIGIEKRTKDVTVAIDGLTLTNSQGNGMMIYGDVNVKLTNCAFTNNEIDGSGGGLGIAENNGSPTVTLTNCTFTGNTANVDSDPLSASGQGGGLYVGNAKVTMTNCTFAGNTAEQYGGGLYVEGNSTVTVANCTFTGNTAKGYKANDGTEVPGWGGGLCVMGDAAVTMANCTFAGNTAGYGAEVFMLAYQGVPTLSAANTVFWNSAAGGKYLALAKYGDVAYPTLNLYNCAYAANAVAGLVPGGNNGLVDGNDALQITEIGCVKTLDWSAGHNAVEKEVTVADDVKMTHTVVLLTAKDTALIGTGLKVSEKPIDALPDDVKETLKKDQLGHTRNTTPDIGAWEYINVEGVALKSPGVEITVGEEVTLSATVSPDNAVNTDVKWSVSEGADKVALYLGTTKLEDGAVLSRDKQVTVKGLAAGTATVKATSAVDSQKSVICTVTVNKADITPSVSISNWTYGDNPSTPTVTAESNPGNGDVTYYYNTTNSNTGGTEWKNITGTTLNAGTYYLYATVAESTNYNAAITATAEFTISAKEVTPTVTVSGPCTYTGKAQTPAVTVKDGDTVIPDTEYTVSYKDNTNAGTATVTITDKSGGNYSVGKVTQNFTINRKAVTVTADDKSKTYGEADPTLTATVTGLVNGDSIAYTLSRATGEAAGTYTITPAGSAEQGNYTVTFKTGTLTIAKAAPDNPNPADPDNPSNPSDDLTEEQRAAQDEAEKKQAQDTAEKAEKAGEAAKTVDTSTESGQALADMLSGTAQGSTKEQQAAALEVKEELAQSGLEAKDLTASEIRSAVTNKEQERKDAVYEASGQVEKTTVPAATDLLENYSSNEDLQAANKELTVQPKVVEPEVLNETSRDQAATNINKAARGEQEVAEGVDSRAVQAAATEGLQTNIEIESADKDLKAQTEAVEKVFNLVSGDLASAGGRGVVIATVFPRMRANATGFFPLRVNLRNLLPGRRLKFWPSVSHFKRQAQSEAAVSGVELAAAGEEGQYFFLDENGVPTAVVSGDASRMTVCAYLEGGKPYTDVFITADATEKDQEALDDLAEKAAGNPDSPTSNKGSGGCDAGLGGVALLALAGLVATRKH